MKNKKFEFFINLRIDLYIKVNFYRFFKTRPLLFIINFTFILDKKIIKLGVKAAEMNVFSNQNYKHRRRKRFEELQKSYVDLEDLCLKLF